MKPVAWQALASRVARTFDIPLAELLHAPRGRKRVWPARFALCHMMRSRGTMSLPQIGRLLNRDHTSVLHAIRRCDDMLATDPVFAGLYAEARAL